MKRNVGFISYNLQYRLINHFKISSLQIFTISSVNKLQKLIIKVEQSNKI